MARRRRARWLGFVAASLVAGACGFPDVTYSDGGADDGGGPDVSAADSPAGAEGSSTHDAAGAGDAPVGADAPGEGEASSGGDAPTGGDASDATSPVESGGPEASVDSSGEAAVESGSEAGPDAAADASPDSPADVETVDVNEASTVDTLVCDEDGDTYLNKNIAACAGGNDCCDTDKAAHPGVTAWFTTADACSSFDYNCNGQLDPQYPTSLHCGGTGLTGCTGGSGFQSDPGCGNSGVLYTCTAPSGLSLACTPGDPISVTQGCH